MKEFGMGYQAIDACPNDHIIYYGQYALENECPQCQTSRYRTDKVTKNVPHKVLRYSYNSMSPAVVQVSKYSTIYGFPCKEQKSR